MTWQYVFAAEVLFVFKKLTEFSVGIENHLKEYRKILTVYPGEWHWGEGDLHVLLRPALHQCTVYNLHGLRKRSGKLYHPLGLPAQKQRGRLAFSFSFTPHISSVTKPYAFTS